MAISEYRVIESADRTFTVEAWYGSGTLIFERRGFRTREEAEAWITPVAAKEAHPITTTKPTRQPSWFIDVEAEEPAV
jgi:hypothetical protein